MPTIVCRLREREKIYLIVLKRDGIGIGELPYEKLLNRLPRPIPSRF